MLHHKVRNLSGRCGILTGATSGVGRALARLLAERGVRLVISGRRESRLNDLASEYPGVLIPLSGDITNSKFQEELVGKAEAAFGGIDLVIAAAGAGAVGSFSESSLDTMRRVVEIDFFAKHYNKSHEQVLDQLIEAGLDRIPGGGAEIFDHEIRKKIDITTKPEEIFSISNLKSLNNLYDLVFLFPIKSVTA